MRNDCSINFCSPYCMIYLWWETERENWSWSLVLGPRRPIILSVPSHVVDVDVSRPVEVSIGSRLTTAANATVVIACPAKGSPEPTISWSHNQRPVVPGGKYSISEHGLSLTVRNVTRDDEGRVECRATNVAGNTSSSLKMQLAGKKCFSLNLSLRKMNLTQPRKLLNPELSN